MPTDTTAPLTCAELDRLTCQAPGCSHEDHGPLFLHSRCHTKSPTIVRCWGDGVLEIRCKVENAFISSIQLADDTYPALVEQIVCNDPNCKEPAANHTIVLKPPCHPKAGAFALYQDGHLSIICAKCKKGVVGLHVARAQGDQSFSGAGAPS